MARYMLRRLIAAVPLVVGLATIVFFLFNALPGDPANLLVAPGLSQEIQDQIRANLGLDEPVHVRYVKWMVALLTGDFGYSYSHGQPVASVMLSVLPNTLLLSATALALAFGAGIVLGTVQAVRHRTALDSTLSVVLLFFYSMPSFWLALMLILAFSLNARNVWEWPLWFPASGIHHVDYDLFTPWGKVRDRIVHLVLPTLSLGLGLAAGIARYQRGAMLDVIRQDFVRTARAKGLGPHAVVFKHALRNALIPVITLLGLYLPVLFSGAVFIETVFAWPGMGKTIVDAIQMRDYPLVMAGSFLFACMVVVGSLIADVLYAVVDPRIRYG